MSRHNQNSLERAWLRIMIDQIRHSYSSTKDFWECAKRYHYRVTTPDSAVPNEHMVFGKIVHSSIERYEKYDKSITKLVGWSLHEWEREMATSSFLEGKIPRPPKSFKRMYENYIHIIKPKLPAKDIEVEKFFKISLAYSPDGETKISFVGKIDRIDSGGIYDWKTSERLPDTYELHDNQFFAYWWAYRKLYGENPSRIVYGHLGSGNLYNIDMSVSLLRNFENLLDKTTEVVYNAWRMERFPRIIGYQCKRCPFRSICFRELAEEEEHVKDC